MDLYFIEIFYDSTPWLCICKRVYIGCASCQFHFNINKLFFNLQSLTDYLWIYILDHDFINKITTPYYSPLPKEKFSIRAYDPITHHRLEESFLIVPAPVDQDSRPFFRFASDISICNSPSHFRARSIGYPVFGISETYGKASPFACRKTLCFMQSPGRWKKNCRTCFRRMVRYFSAMLAT